MNRKDFSLVRVAAAISDVKVANVEYNVKSIMGLMSDAFSADVDVIVFPELCDASGYSYLLPQVQKSPHAQEF